MKTKDEIEEEYGEKDLDDLPEEYTGKTKRQKKMDE